MNLTKKTILSTSYELTFMALNCTGVWTKAFPIPYLKVKGYLVKTQGMLTLKEIEKKDD